MDKYNESIATVGNVELIQASQDKDVAAASAWAKKESFPWPTVLLEDIEKTLLKDIKLNGVPTYVLLDREGNILAQANESFSVMRKLKQVNK